jgi:hypothetical protein
MTTLDLIYKNILIYAIAAVLVVGVAVASVGILPMYVQALQGAQRRTVT